MYNIYMIEFLSDESWIRPQIDFLLYLQNIRMQHSEIFNRLFLSVTAIGEYWLPSLICAIYYWGISAKEGTCLFSLCGFSFLFNQFFKMLACVYRPWVLSDKIVPVESATTYARGYSFPSGHSSMAASVVGGLAFILRHKIVWSILLILLVLVVGFSRLWLGVHTPQDVCAGLLTGLFLVFLANFLINRAEKNKNGYLYLLAVINILAVAALIYICYFNQFPRDYVNGELLVNPDRAVRSTIICYGYSLGIINGAFLCRRFFPFDAKAGDIKTRIIRCLVGTILLMFLLICPLEICFRGNLNYKLIFLFPLLMGLCITAGYPLVFSKIKFLYYNDSHGNN